MEELVDNYEKDNKESFDEKKPHIKIIINRIKNMIVIDDILIFSVKIKGSPKCSV